ncbi:hypothetical protein OQA88_5839 [Cercophora sp. LCS_1]
MQVLPAKRHSALTGAAQEASSAQDASTASTDPAEPPTMQENMDLPARASSAASGSESENASRANDMALVLYRPTYSVPVGDRLSSDKSSGADKSSGVSMLRVPRRREVLVEDDTASSSTDLAREGRFKLRYRFRPTRPTPGPLPRKVVIDEYVSEDASDLGWSHSESRPRARRARFRSPSSPVRQVPRWRPASPTLHNSRRTPQPAFESFEPFASPVPSSRPGYWPYPSYWPPEPYMYPSYPPYPPLGPYPYPSYWQPPFSGTYNPFVPENRHIRPEPLRSARAPQLSDSHGRRFSGPRVIRRLSTHSAVDVHGGASPSVVGSFQDFAFAGTPDYQFLPPSPPAPFQVPGLTDWDQGSAQPDNIAGFGAPQLDPRAASDTATSLDGVSTYGSGVDVRLQDHTRYISAAVRGEWQTAITTSAHRTTTLTVILGSSYCTNETGQYNVNMITQSKKPGPQKVAGETDTSQMIWLHVQRDSFQLEHLKELVANCPYLDSDPDYKKIGLELLRHVGSEVEHSFPGGKYIEPGTVVRFNATYDREPSLDEKPVTFFSAPYVLPMRQEDKEHTPDRGPCTHVPRTLLQSLYDYEVTVERDAAQVLPKLYPKNGQTLHVAQLWGLLLGPTVMITCGQAGRDDIAGPRVLFQPIGLAPEHKLILVSVSDADGRQYLMALDSGQAPPTFFDLLDVLSHQRSRFHDDDLDMYDVCLGDDVLTPQKWLDAIQTMRSRVEVVLRPRRVEHPEVIPIIRTPTTVKSLGPRAGRQQKGKGKASIGRLRRRYKPGVGARLGNSRAASEVDDDGDAMSVVSRMSRRSNRSLRSTYSYSKPRNATANTAQEEQMHAGGPSQPPPVVTSFSLGRRDRVPWREGYALLGAELVEPSFVMAGAGALFSVAHPDGEANPFRVSRSRPDTPVSRALEPLDELGEEKLAPKTGSPPKPGPANIGMNETGSTPPQDEAGGKQHEADANMEPLLLAWGTQSSGNKKAMDKILGIVSSRLGQDPSCGVDYRKCLEADRGEFDAAAEGSMDKAARYRRRDSPGPDPVASEGGLEARIPDKILSDKILSYRMYQGHTMQYRALAASEALMALFVPLDLDHEVCNKFRGSILALSTNLDRILGFVRGQPAPPYSQMYYVRDYSAEAGLVRDLSLQAPAFPCSRCAACAADRHYGFVRDAEMHVRRVHTKAGLSALLEPDAAFAGESLTIVVRSANQIRSEAILSSLIAFANDCHQQLTDIRRRVTILSRGLLLAARTTKENDKYLAGIQGRIAHIFELTLRLVVGASQLLSGVDVRLRQVHSITNMPEPHTLFDKARKALRRSGLQVHAVLDEALQDPGLRRAGPRVANLGAVEPESLASTVLANLFLQPLRIANGIGHPQAAVTPGELYKRYTTRLQQSVNDQPQKRLFPDLRFVDEELQALCRVLQWQQRLCMGLASALGPTEPVGAEDAASPPANGSSSYRYLRESLHLEATRQKLSQRELEARALMDRARNLRENLVQTLEILEESHTKAIRVFTIVTLFFLPLTFVSGFMGMNTADIRDTEGDQRVFWQTAVPLTAGVLAIAFVYGYKWEVIRDGVAKWRAERGGRIRSRQHANPSRVLLPAMGAGGGWVWTPGNRWRNRRTTAKHNAKAAVAAKASTGTARGGGFGSRASTTMGRM